MSSTCASTLQAVTTFALPVLFHDPVRELLGEELPVARAGDPARLPGRLDTDRLAVELAQQRPVVRADVDDQIVRARPPTQPSAVAAKSSKFSCNAREFPDEYGYAGGNTTRVDYDR
jgi:hypothetical protein